MLASLILAFAPAVAADMVAGNRITERGPIDDDYYAAGGIIDIDAEINGDLIAAGGNLTIGRSVAGDIIAAGGKVRIRGAVGEDIRVSGGELDIDASVGDDLVASGGSIRLTSTASIAGDAWLYGGKILIDGKINGNLKVIGGDIRLSGMVLGDVELEGGEIEILDSASIAGNLTYRSPQPAVTASGIQVGGRIDYETGESKYGDRGFGLFFSITLALAAILLYLLFPHFTMASVQRIRKDPFTSLGLGFVFFIMTPLLAVFLMLIVLGLWIGLSLLALYCIALLAGFLIACFFVAERGAKLFKQDISSRARRLISVIIAIFVLGLVQAIPLLGGLLLFILLLLGLGAGLVQLRYVYQAPAVDS
ncbi:MAG: hypothetical protein JSU67_00805 [Gammaproteobacteria bacterium]|nr:MAG: hypothetical protein EP300_08265 [Gammaproteobacteria bacterium]UCH40277.1 MAG: hypothetical protein JSU67_00805 [Gammaproteobacteria bacterium]